MDGIILISIIIIAIVVYLFGMIVLSNKREVQSKHHKLYKLDRTGNKMFKLVVFGNIKDEVEEGTDLPLRAISMKIKMKLKNMYYIEK